MTENVYGSVTGSSPAPAIISADGDGFVGGDDLEQFVGMVWDALMDLFSPGDDKHIENLDEKIRKHGKVNFEKGVSAFSAVHAFFTR